MKHEDRYGKLHFGMLVLLLLFAFLTQKAFAEPLSVRNNNAGNVKFSKSNDWIGQIGQEKGFVKFNTKEHGLRAMKLVIKANIRATKTIDSFVVRYAGEPNEDIHTPHLSNYSREIKEQLGREYILESDTESIAPLMVYLEGGTDAVKYFYGDTLWKKNNLESQSLLLLQKRTVVEVGMSEQQILQKDICIQTSKLETLHKIQKLKSGLDISERKQKLLMQYINTMRRQINDSST